MFREFLRRVLLVAFGFVTLMSDVTHACVNNPPTTRIRRLGVGVNSFDPWTTFSVTSGHNCGVAFRFSSDIVASVDEVNLVETGTLEPLLSFGEWTANPITEASVEDIAPTSPADKWYAFTSTVVSDVPQGIEADFAVRVNLHDGFNDDDFIRSILANGIDMIFTDEVDGSGLPLQSHQGFTTVVPEPSASLLIIPGMVMVLCWRRKRLSLL